MKIKKRTFYVPYNFDGRYEIKTYSNVGKDYGDSKTANKGFLFNFFRFYRKVKNNDELQYKRCDTYSDWKSYIEGKYEDVKNVDFHKYLYMRRRQAKQSAELIKAIVVPVEVAILSLVFKENTNIDIWVVSAAALFLCIFLSYEISNYNEEENFYEDCINVLFADENNHDA